MKTWKMTTAALLIGAFLLAPITSWSAETKNTAPKAKPYPLKTCVVTGEKLDAMGKPYVFVHEGQEIKLCCKGCLKAFEKEPAKFLKKMDEAAKKTK
jgi:hypothetical protein